MDRDFLNIVTPIGAMLFFGIAIDAGLSALIAWSFPCAMLAFGALSLCVLCTFSMWLLSV